MIQPLDWYHSSHNVIMRKDPLQYGDKMQVNDIPEISRLSVPEKILLVEIYGTASHRMDRACLSLRAIKKIWTDASGFMNPTAENFSLLRNSRRR